MTFDSYYHGGVYGEAYDVALSVAQNPAKVRNPLILYGGSGNGKTHLMRAIASHCSSSVKTEFIYAESLVSEMLPYLKDSDMATFKADMAMNDVLLVDGLEFVEWKEQTAIEVLGLFVHMVNMGKQVVVSSNSTMLSGLVEKMEDYFGVEAVYLPTPDEPTAMGIVDTLCERQGITLTEEQKKLCWAPHMGVGYIRGRINIFKNESSC